VLLSESWWQRKKSLPNSNPKWAMANAADIWAFRVSLTELRRSVNHLDGEGLSDLNNPAMHKIVSTTSSLSRALLLKTLSRPTGYVVRPP
jgi:hypothetical protein